MPLESKPCCSSLTQSGIGQYATYLNWLRRDVYTREKQAPKEEQADDEEGEEEGEQPALQFTLVTEALRIPSTKNISMVGFVRGAIGVDRLREEPGPAY